MNSGSSYHGEAPPSRWNTQDSHRHLNIGMHFTTLFHMHKQLWMYRVLCVHMMRPERLKLVRKGPTSHWGRIGWGWSYTLRTQSLLYWCTYFHGQSRHLVPGCFGHGTCSRSPSQWQLWVKGRHAHSNFLPGWILKGHAYVSSRSWVHALWTPYGFCWACGRVQLMHSVQFQR